MCAIPSEETAPGTDETFTAYELANALAGRVGLADAADVIAGLLRRLIPADLCAFYMHDCRSGELEAQYIVGDGGVAIQGLRIELGQRLSGWVAANRLSIVNSDAALDLGDRARAISPRMRTCLSTPLVLGDELVGVLSLYSAEPSPFGDKHRRTIEGLSSQIAQCLKNSVDFDNSAKDVLTGLPNSTELEKLLSAATTESGRH